VFYTIREKASSLISDICLNLNGSKHSKIMGVPETYIEIDIIDIN